MARRMFMSLLAVGLSAGTAVAAPPPATPADVAVFKERGAYVFRAAPDSLPLYTYDRDQAGKSSCAGSCAVAWPPFSVSEGSAPVGEWSIVKRDDGKSQWAWRGRPIYRFAHDGPEKANGDGLGGVWKLIPTLPAN